MQKKLLMLIAAILVISASAQTKRALVVGISEYQSCGTNSWGSIHGANDAKIIVPVLKAQGFKVTKVCNKYATAKRIRKELNTLEALCKPGDIIYLHFSCHGQPFEDLDGDEEDGWDESIVPYDAQKVFKKGKYEGQNHVTDDELHIYFQKIRKKIGKSGFVCVVVDACHAGSTSRGEEETEGEKFVRGTNIGFSSNGKDYSPKTNKSRVFLIPQESGLADITILEACRHYQSNYEIVQSGEYYGPLSYYVSLVLNNNELTNSLDWVKDVQTQIENRYKNSFKRKQNMVYETTLQKS